MGAARGEYRFICDADLSMPIEEVNRFLPPVLEGYDIAIASREAPGAVRYGEPAYRHWIGRIFNALVRSLAVPHFQDTQCGFKCFRASVAEDLFSVQRLDGWTFDVEVLFIGWELVGLSSALLVGFFHERPAPVSNALRVFSVYRISDTAMLSAAVLVPIFGQMARSPMVLLLLSPVLGYVGHGSFSMFGSFVA